MNWTKIWQAALPILKIVGVGALGGAVQKGAEVLSGSGTELAPILASTAAVVGAYLLKQPYSKK